MFLMLLAALQQAGPVLPAAPKPGGGGRSCDAVAPPRDGSLPRGDEDIVVCARSQEQYRLRALPPQRVAGPAIPKAETGFIGKSKIGVETETAGVGGFTSKRAMVRLKVPF